MLEAMLIGACIGWIGWGIYRFLDDAPWTWASDARYVAKLQQQEHDLRTRWAKEDEERGIHWSGCKCWDCLQWRYSSKGRPQCKPQSVETKR